MAPTPVLLPGKSHGRRSLVGCNPWGLEELDTTGQNPGYLVFRPFSNWIVWFFLTVSFESSLYALDEFFLRNVHRNFFLYLCSLSFHQSLLQS